MLTKGIHSAFGKGVADLANHSAVEVLARGAEAAGSNRGQAAIFTTSGTDFIAHPRLPDEVFGAASIVVRCADLAGLRGVLGAMEGQLTATLQLDEADHEVARGLLPQLERKAGRVLANGWPTGVEVSWAMVHGGPFPATSDPRSTSVGAAAIDRFLRPICYQDVPDALLPAAVRSDNPLNLPRFLNAQ
jgi:NADP-dependent aldehyde dehydrogenase